MRLYFTYHHLINCIHNVIPLENWKKITINKMYNIIKDKFIIHFIPCYEPIIVHVIKSECPCTFFRPCFFSVWIFFGWYLF